MMTISIVLDDKKMQRVSLGMFRDIDLEKLQVASAVMPNEHFRNVAGESGLSINEFTLEEVTYCVAHKDLDFFESPRPSRSKEYGSGALYLAQRDSGVRSLLLQYLLPFTITSPHGHKITTEYFHGLEGSCVIEATSGNVILNRSTVELKPRTWHQLRTGEEPSLALIEMFGNPKGLSMDDHYRDISEL